MKLRRIHEIFKRTKESIIKYGPSNIVFSRSCKAARKKYAELGGEKDITILTPNCIGGEIYHILGLKFNSPFINGSMKRADFIKFCANFDEYLKLKPFISGHSANHPIMSLEGKGLDRIDIRFVHDNNDDVVLNNWERRKKRIIRDKCYIIMDNKDERGKPLPDHLLKKINDFKCKKTIIFVANDTKVANTFRISKKQISRYNYRKMSGLYGFQDFFDFVSFLTNEKTNNETAKKARSKSGLAKNYAFNVAYKIVNIIIPLITAPYLSRIMGADGIGVYTFYYSIAHYFYLFGKMGLNNYGTREIATFKDDYEKMSTIFSTIYLQQIVTSGIMLLCYAVFCIFSFQSGGVIPLLLGLYALGCLFDIDWLYFGLERFDKVAIKNILVKIIGVIAIFALVKSSDDLWLYTLIMSASMLIGFLTLWTGIRKNVSFKKVNFKSILPHFKPNLILLFPILATNVYRSLDKVMVGSMSSMEELGYYENAEKIVYAISSFITAFNNIMMPKCTKLIAKGKEDRCVKHINNTMQFLFFLILMMASTILGLSNSIVIIAFGDNFTPSIVLLQLLIVSLMFMIWSDVIRQLWVIPHKKDKIFLKTIATGAITDLVLNLILIPQYGAIGASIATIVAELSVVIAQFVILRKELNYASILKKQIVFIIASIANASILLIIQSQLDINLFSLGLLGVIGAVLFTTICVAILALFDRKQLVIYVHYLNKYRHSKKSQIRIA